MGVAITFCYETKRERRENKHDHSFFGRSEAESLSRLIQFEAHSVFQLRCNFLTAAIIAQKTGDFSFRPWRSQGRLPQKLASIDETHNRATGHLPSQKAPYWRRLLY